MNKYKVTLAFDPQLAPMLFDEKNRAELSKFSDVDFNQILTDYTPENLEAIAHTEILLTGWACPGIDAAVLDALPNLKAIIHSAGSVRFFLSEEVWKRGIKVSSAASANAIPVAEYSVAAILFAGKGAFTSRELYRQRRGAIDQQGELGAIGNFRRIVGIVGASTIGRLVIAKLADSDMDIQVADPYLSEEDAKKLGVRKVNLDELFNSSDVISIHAPLLQETSGMITGQLIKSMKSGSTLINTARGALIDQESLIIELQTGRINAVIDTTFPEVPEYESKLYELPNVFLTPHIAGALGNEITRLGAFAVNEIKLLREDQRLLGEVSLSQFKLMA